MQITKALTAGVWAASSATAQLLVGSALRSVRQNSGQALISSFIPNALDVAQVPLNNGHDKAGSQQIPPFKAGSYTLTPQSNSTCATHGEAHWTGTVDVTDERRLFFWFFDSRNDPENDPVAIWINGGPGGSSLMGLFNEMGPCWLEPDSEHTTPNEWAWNNNASLLFIDQPAGVGFSSVAPGSRLPDSDIDGAQDFQVFLNIFFDKVFPDRAKLPIHFAAESYGGHYAPTYVHHIIESRRYDSRTAFRGNITSIILVDALIDFTSMTIGSYEVLCTEFRRLDSEPRGNILNETSCDAIRLAVPECERLGRSCDLAYDGLECLAARSFCEDNLQVYYAELIEAGLKNPYNIHKDCDVPPMCGESNKGNITTYLNQKAIKSALNFPDTFPFIHVNLEINENYQRTGSMDKPTSRELGAILDSYRTNKLADIKLLVLQGNVDASCNTPGNMWLYDKLLWSGHADYRMAKYEELPEGLAATGFWKATKDGRLAFVALDGAGHTVPGDVREGSYRVFQKWIEGDWHM